MLSYIHTCIRIHIYIHIYIHIHMHIHIHRYIYIHTHTHTHTVCALRRASKMDARGEKKRTHKIMPANMAPRLHMSRE